MKIWIVLLLCSAVAMAELEETIADEDIKNLLNNILYPNNNYNDYDSGTIGTNMGLRNTWDFCKRVLRRDQLVRLHKTYYYVARTPATWVQAREACTLRGMQLVQIDSTAEYQAILNYLNNNGFLNADDTSYWTAGNDLGNEGIYNNLLLNPDQTINVKSLNWATGQPLGTTAENCLEIRRFTSSNSGLNDNVCTTSINGYICEISWQCQMAYEARNFFNRRPSGGLFNRDSSN